MSPIVNDGLSLTDDYFAGLDEKLKGHPVSLPGPPEAPRQPELAQHTPGPWYAKPPTDWGWEVHNAAEAIVAPDLGLDEADAYLIAAAPELLEATRSLYRLLREWRRAPFFDDPHEWQRWADDLAPRVDEASTQAESAIAKATGRQL